MILFCCAKRSISPSKAETSAKRSRSFYGRNSTAQKPQNQRLYTPFFSPWFFIKSASLFCEAVLSGRTERLTQWNKTVLLSGKIPFLFSSICQIPFRLFFRKNRLFFLKIASLETAISCLAFWVLRMASSSFL